MQFIPERFDTYQSVVLTPKDELLRRRRTAEVLRYGQATQAVACVVEITEPGRIRGEGVCVCVSRDSVSRFVLKYPGLCYCVCFQVLSGTYFQGLSRSPIQCVGVSESYQACLNVQRVCVCV